MTHKTKAEKIAAALRAKRDTFPSAPSGIGTGSIQPLSQVPPALASHPSPTIRHDADVYEPKDLRKTIVITLLIVALLTLVYVFQYKGYF